MIIVPLRRTTSSSASSTESDACRFLDQMRERLQKFALTLHPEKTRLIEFRDAFAAERRQRRGLGKPETFNFPGLHLHLRQELGMENGCGTSFAATSNYHAVPTNAAGTARVSGTM